jgi:hypothetical protein
MDGKTMSFKIQKLRVLWLGCVLAMTACGAAPTSSTLHESQASAAVAIPTAAPPVPGAPLDTRTGAALVSRAKALFEAMPAYRLKVWFSQKGPSKKSVGRYEITGQQRTMRINILEGNEVGTKVLWRGGPSATVRPPGFLSAITVDLALTDHRLLSVRDYTLAQTDLHAMFGYMSDANNQLTQTAPDGVDIRGPKLLPGCGTMHVTFDLVTGLPKTLEMSDSKEVVYQLRIEQLTRLSSVDLSI